MKRTFIWIRPDNLIDLLYSIDLASLIDEKRETIDSISKLNKATSFGEYKVVVVVVDHTQVTQVVGSTFLQYRPIKWFRLEDQVTLNTAHAEITRDRRNTNMFVCIINEVSLIRQLVNELLVVQIWRHSKKLWLIRTHRNDWMGTAIPFPPCRTSLLFSRFRRKNNLFQPNFVISLVMFRRIGRSNCFTQFLFFKWNEGKNQRRSRVMSIQPSGGNGTDGCRAPVQRRLNSQRG